MNPMIHSNSSVAHLKDVSISTAAHRARNLLRSCLNGPDKKLGEVAEIQLGRFNLWASNIGVFASRHASLDYRLRTAPVPRMAVESTLQSLCNEMISVLSGHADPTDEEFDDFDATPDSQLIVFGRKLIESSLNKHEVRLALFQAVETRISNLHQLSLAIRKASNRTSVVKAPRLLDRDEGFSVIRIVEDPTTHVDPFIYEITDRFTEFLRQTLTVRWLKSLAETQTQDVQSDRLHEPNADGSSQIAAASYNNETQVTHVGTQDIEQSRTATKDKDADLDTGQKEYRQHLLNRCVTAIAARRRQLSYFRDHQVKLAVGTSVSTEATKSHTDSGMKGVHSSGALIPNIPKGQWPQKTINKERYDVPLSETVPSTIEPNSFRIPTSTRAPSSTASSTDAGMLRSADHFEIPPAPEVLSTETEKMCPYCCLVLPAKTFAADKKSSKWRKHLLDDLQPYVCLFKNCDQPGRTYQTFREWQKHLDLPHYLDRMCPLSHSSAASIENQSFSFTTIKKFREHLNNEHVELQADAVECIIHESTSLDVLPEWCFVCLSPQASTAALQRHLAGHLAQAFLLALPIRDDVKDSGDAQSDRMLSAVLTDPGQAEDLSLPNLSGLYDDTGSEAVTSDGPKLSSQDFELQLKKLNTQNQDWSRPLLWSAAGSTSSRERQAEEAFGLKRRLPGRWRGKGGLYGSPLQAAACSGHRDIVRLLLDAGADVNARGGEYGDALLAASVSGHLDVVTILLEAGADTNRYDDCYGNALMVASWYGYQDVVQCLIDAGADVNSRGGQLVSALQAATAAKRTNITRILLAAGAYG